MKLVKFLLIILAVVISSIIAIAYLKPTLITKTALKPVLENRCEAELQAHKLWQTASLFLGEDDQAKSLSRICGCVVEHATNEITPKQLLHALVDDEAKNQLASKAMMNGIQGCVKETVFKQP